MSLEQRGPKGKSTQRSVLLKKVQAAFSERPVEPIEIESSILRRWTRRDLLILGAGALATLAVGGLQLPRRVWQELGLDQGGTTEPENKWLLSQALRLDDDVSKLLYSPRHLVPTYSKSQVTALKNNYNGATPDPAYIPGWRLTLDGLASGLTVSLDIQTLLARYRIHDQITRLVCVEGWSAIAWWSGLRFDELLRAYPPVSEAKWLLLESSVNLDANGNPDPYFVSIDLLTAKHPQTLLATHQNGKPLSVDHGAPLRLVVPMKLGLKNIKAITRITYMKDEPPDYWAKRGYSGYDGI